MKTFVSIIAIFITMATVEGQFQHKRQLLIFAGTNNNEQLKRQQSLLDSVNNECIERDLVVSIIASSNATVIKRYSVAANAFNVVLIGKDGGVKYKTQSVVLPSTIFSIIDAMPMRKAEMRARH